MTNNSSEKLRKLYASLTNENKNSPGHSMALRRMTLLVGDFYTMSKESKPSTVEQELDTAISTIKKIVMEMEKILNES